MATLVLAAAGAAVGAAFGSATVAGLSGAIIGRAIGATLGQMVDQRIFGSGSAPVRTGRIDRFRLMGASEGAAIPRVWGRARIGGQVIWASRFQERVVEKGGGGKGNATTPEIEQYRYSVSVAIALCEGPILRVGRIWADGNEVDPSQFNMRVYPGDEAQLPDPKIAAVEGLENAPAYRGTAYVVFEDLALGPFGNRVPQFSFEVVRGARGPLGSAGQTLGTRLQAVALIPGTGEFALARKVVRAHRKSGRGRALNRNGATARSDFAESFAQLLGEAPNLKAASIVVSWFGDDLRCGQCQIRPKVERQSADAEDMPWRSGGLDRKSADHVAEIDGRPVYGGTPSDQSVIDAITAFRTAGKSTMVYPFVLMDQLAGNARTDPWTGAADQPALPWRGRITLSQAPGRDGSPDRTAGGEAELGAFLGQARVDDVIIRNKTIVPRGVTDWGYRRFILHYARLCQLAGGVDAFCIGSEFRGLTQIRGAGDSFPFVQELRRLAGDVRAILGPKTKISYAADWSEYFGYVADGNRYHHLDPLWADENIDFVGIDNYMPVSDWRDGESHLDAGFGSIYNPDYLARNIQGGEGFDWYYASAEGLAAQRREPIRDHLGEDWIWRYKDLKSWWSEPHFERIGGVRQDSSTAWIPMSKPIWFTELGCAAIDKGGNQPNLFLDPKSSESALPRFSNGQRDDLMQMQYHLTQSDYWARPENNPVSALDGRRMLDPERCFAWAWDARPYPVFPLRETVWGDAANYERGHWLNGRSSAASLRDVVDEILIAAGARHFDTSRLYGLVRGYVDNGSESVRAALQPLMLACGFDCFESEGVLHFVSRQHQDVTVIDTDRVVAQADGDIQRQRSAPSELPRVMRLGHVEADGAYESRLATVALPGPDGLTTVADAEVTLVLTPGEARNAADRGLVAAQVGRETLRFALPRSMMQIRPGDLLQLGPQIVRVDRIAEGASLELEATCVNTLAGQSQSVPSRAAPADFGPEDTGFLPLLLDLPLLTSEAASYAPYVAIGAEVWPGLIALWDSASENDFRLNCLVAAPSVMGQTETDLNAGPPGLFHAQASLRVALLSGSLASVEMTALLNGDNLAAIGDAEAQRWEIIQFKTARPVAAGVWELSGLLRGQYGTDAVGPAVWPPGSSFVLLGRTREQIRLDPEAAELRRHYRFGLASQGYDAESVVESVTAFAGNGRRPYAVCHLRHERRAEADRFSWIRRTRLGGDSWSGLEVPLGEAAEAYRLRVIALGRTVREVTLQGPSWDYPLDLRRQDGLGGSYEVEVAQLSDSFGAGPARRIVVG